MKFNEMEESRKLEVLREQLIELQKNLHLLSHRVLRLERIGKSLEKEYEGIDRDKMVGG